MNKVDTQKKRKTEEDIFVMSDALMSMILDVILGQTYLEKSMRAFNYYTPP